LRLQISSADGWEHPTDPVYVHPPPTFRSRPQSAARSAAFPEILKFPGGGRLLPPGQFFETHKPQQQYMRAQVVRKPAKSCGKRKVRKVRKMESVIARAAALTTHAKLLGRRAPCLDQHRRHAQLTALPKPPPLAPCLRCKCVDIAGTARAISLRSLFASGLS